MNEIFSHIRYKVRHDIVFNIFLFFSDLSCLAFGFHKNAVGLERKVTSMMCMEIFYCTPS